MGAALMRKLGLKLTDVGWDPGKIENWRDCGWSITCEKSSSKLEIATCWVERGYWILQIKPLYVPGLIGRILGKKNSASSRDVYELALAAHEALRSLSYLGNPHWRWDKFPDEEHSTTEPTAG